VTELLYDASSLVYSSYLSGNGTDAASGTTIDASGFIYVTGTTTSTDVSSATDQFPASNLPQGLPYQSISRAPGLAQFFVTKINTNAPREQSIAYSTYFGGGSFATTAPVVTGGGIAVDTTGNVYFTGTTNYTYTGCSGCSNSDFPILNAYQPCLDQAPPSVIVTPPQCTNTGSLSDAFVAKLNPNASQGQQLIWSIVENISEQRRGEAVLIDARNAAEAASIAKSEFLSNMSHEIRTPLTGVVGFAGLLQGMAGLPTEAQRYAARIASSAEALMVVVNDVLDFSKLEACQMELDPHPFDLGALVETVADLYRDRAAEG